MNAGVTYLVGLAKDCDLGAEVGQGGLHRAQSDRKVSVLFLDVLLLPIQARRSISVSVS